MLLAFLPAAAWADASNPPARVVSPASGGSTDVFFGSYRHDVAIAVPPFHGLEPQLRLSYSSSGGNGLVGVGWHLDGFGVIELTSARQGTPRFDGKDQYLLDGEVLIPCPPGSASPSCRMGGTHATRVESYRRVTYDAGAREWSVWERDGRRAVYRVLSSSTCQGPCVTRPTGPGGPGTPMRWGLAQVTDPHHMTTSYGWRLDSGEWYPDTIDYNGVHIQINTETRPDPIVYAVGGDLVRIAQRIRSIDVKVSGSRLRAYALGYGQSGATARSLLTSVQLFGRDATVSNGVVSGPTALPAATFTYQQATGAPFGLSLATAPMSVQSARTRLGDFDGDGREDVAYFADGTPQVQVALATGFQAYTSPAGPVYSNQMQVGDFDGDGRSDLLVVPYRGDHVDVWLAQDGNCVHRDVMGPLGPGASYCPADCVPPDVMGPLLPGSHYCPTVSFREVRFPVSGYRFDASRVRVGDFNGDGKADFADVMDGASQINVFLSRGDGTFHLVGVPMPHQMASARVQTGDFDGDGRTDLYEVTDGSDHVEVWLASDQGPTGCMNPPPGFVGPYIPCATPVGFQVVSSLLWPGYASAGHRLRALDINGDGKTDLVDILDGSKYVVSWLSQGDGTFKLVRFGAWDGYSVASGQFQVGDFNGDGRADLLHLVDGSSQAWLWTSLGDGTFAISGFNAGSSYGISSARARTADTDGDGRTDLVDVLDGTPYTWRWVSPGGANDLLVGAANGLGGTESVEYAPSTAAVNTNNPPVMQTVQAVTVADGRGGSSRTTSSYAGGLYDRLFRRFLGFHYAKETFADRATRETWFHQDYGSVSQPERIDLRDAGGTLLSSSSISYFTSGATMPYTSVETERWTYEYAGSATRRRRVTRDWDNNGANYRTIDYGDYDLTGDERTDKIFFAPNSSAYIIDRPALVRRFDAPGDGTMGYPLAAETQYYYDGAQSWNQPPTAGDATSTLRWLGQGGAYVVARAEYDGVGNRTASYDENGAVTRWTYDSGYQLFPELVQNALGQATSAAFDPVCGVTTQSVDLNGQATTYSYDPLCRLIATHRPGGGFELRTYESFGNVAAQAVLVESPSADGAGNQWHRTRFDGLGRTWWQAAKGAAAGRQICVATTYDTRGRVATVSEPFYWGDSAVWTQLSYDSLGRLLRTAFPDGSASTQSYGAQTVTTQDEAGHLSVDLTDGRGRVVEHREWSGSRWLTVSYSYDGYDHPLRIADPVGNMWTFSWDSLGRKVAAHDPDAGDWRWEYDNVGRARAWVDAIGQRTEVGYDALGRMTGKTTRQGTARQVAVGWRYDEPRTTYANVGQLTSVFDPSGGATLDWDAGGRLTRLSRTTDGQGFVIERSWDAGDRLLVDRYDGQAVTYAYDGAGRVRAIAGLVDGATYDASGRLVGQWNSNGTVTARTFSPRGRLGSITTQAGSTTIQSLTYARDADGRITQITSPFNDESWSYGYDALHRLVQASVPGDATRSYAFAYDATGNLLSSDFQGTFSYPPAGQARPHAVIATAAAPLAYDADGNVLRGNGRILDYDGDNHLVGIRSGSSTWSYAYDADGNRIKRVQDGRTTYFLGADYELAAGVAKRTVMLAGLPAAELSGGAPRWLHVDHLGAVQITTDASAKVLERSHSAPYREPLDTVATEEESDDDAGLQYMHARYYDPETGRFLSPDPLPNPEHLIGLAGYAYAKDDPINCVDPTGLDPWDGQQGWPTITLGDFTGRVMVGSRLWNQYAQLQSDTLHIIADTYLMEGRSQSAENAEAMSRQWLQVGGGVYQSGDTYGSSFSSDPNSQPMMRPTYAPGVSVGVGASTPYVMPSAGFVTPGPMMGLEFEPDGSLRFLNFLNPNPSPPTMGWGTILLAGNTRPPQRPAPKPAPPPPPPPPPPAPPRAATDAPLGTSPVRAATARPAPATGTGAGSGAVRAPAVGLTPGVAYDPPGSRNHVSPFRVENGRASTAPTGYDRRNYLYSLAALAGQNGVTLTLPEDLSTVPDSELSDAIANVQRALAGQGVVYPSLSNWVNQQTFNGVGGSTGRVVVDRRYGILVNRGQLLSLPGATELTTGAGRVQLVPMLDLRGLPHYAAFVERKFAPNQAGAPDGYPVVSPDVHAALGGKGPNLVTAGSFDRVFPSGASINSIQEYYDLPATVGQSAALADALEFTYRTAPFLFGPLGALVGLGANAALDLAQGDYWSGSSNAAMMGLMMLSGNLRGAALALRLALAGIVFADGGRRIYTGVSSGQAGGALNGLFQLLSLLPVLAELKAAGQLGNDAATLERALQASATNPATTTAIRTTMKAQAGLDGVADAAADLELVARLTRNAGPIGTTAPKVLKPMWQDPANAQLRAALEGEVQSLGELRDAMAAEILAGNYDRAIDLAKGVNGPLTTAVGVDVDTASKAVGEHFFGGTGLSVPLSVLEDMARVLFNKAQLGQNKLVATFLTPGAATTAEERARMALTAYEEITHLSQKVEGLAYNDPFVSRGLAPMQDITRGLADADMLKLAEIDVFRDMIQRGLIASTDWMLRWVQNHPERYGVWLEFASGAPHTYPARLMLPAPR
jgi:RHS repeat-associated protein